MVIKHFSYILLLFLAFIFGCKNNYGKLKLVTKLPKNLNEVSGIAFDAKEDSFYMINDSGNSSKVYKISNKGEILSTLHIKGKNKDWEDLTFDDSNNLYIGDFGNNENVRKGLRILKISNEDLILGKKIKIEKINFFYPEQKKFPPKNNKKFYDAEAFFYFNNYFYIFTKNQVKNKYGTTKLYKVPAKKGNHKALLLAIYKGCSKNACAITSAAISKDNKRIALLSSKEVLIFSNFKGDDFFNGTLTTKKLKFQSQKESICFKDNNTLLIADEKATGTGGNLYEISID
jgi:hypothetical protein